VLISPLRGRRDRRIWIVVVVLILLAFGLRVFRLDTQSLWFDEGWSAYVASLRPAQALAEIAGPDHTHPPGFYLALGAWVFRTGSSEAMLRYLSVIQGVLLMAVGGAYAARLFGRAAGVLAVAALAGLPALVVYSQETRMYMQLALLYVALAWAYREIATRTAPKWPLWLALFALQSAALYTHYFAAILIAWLLLVAVVDIAVRDTGSVRRIKLGKLVLVQALCAIAYLPWAGVTIRQLADHTPHAAVPPAFTAFVVQTWRFFNSGLLGMAASKPLFAWASGIAGVLFVVVIAIALARVRARRDLAVLLAHGLVPLAAVYVISQGRPGVHPRYVLMAAAPLMMALSAGVAWLTSSGRRRAGELSVGVLRRDGQRSASDLGAYVRLGLAAATTASFLVAWSVALAGYYDDPQYYRDDVRAVARYVSENAEAGDVVVLDYADHAFPYYYDGRAPVHVLDLVRAEDNAALELVSDIADGNRAFVVRWSGGRTDYRGTIPALFELRGRYDGRHDEGPFAVDRYIADTEGDHAKGDPLVLALVHQDADFGDIRLSDAASPTTTAADDALVVATRWTTPVETARRLKSVVEVTDWSGNRIAHADTMIHDKHGLTTDLWPAGTEATVYTVIPLPVGSPPGEYGVAVGVYDAGDLRDLQLRGSSGAPAGTRQALSQVRVTEAADFVSDPYDTLGRLGIGPVDQVLTPGITVEGVATDSAAVTPGQMLGVTILWRADRPPGRRIMPELRLVIDGETVALDAPSSALLSHPSDLWRAGERVLDRRSALVPPDLVGESAWLEIVEGGRKLPLVELSVAEVPHVYEAPESEHASGVVFPGVGELVGFSLETDGSCRIEDDRANGKPGSDPGAVSLVVVDSGQCRVVVTHVWRAEGSTAADLKVFNHLLGTDRRMLAQHDGQPGAGERPTTGWLPGEYVTDRHELLFVEGLLPAGPATLEVGLYDPATMARIPTSDGADRAVLGPELVVEQPASRR
jgi:4-amino-4-deoxy-L-arabinose transferase-like glycosyltransferase